MSEYTKYILNTLFSEMITLVEFIYMTIIQYRSYDLFCLYDGLYILDGEIKQEICQSVDFKLDCYGDMRYVSNISNL
jgi:hypothetical protein